MTPEELSALIRQILVTQAADTGLDSNAIPETVKVERPRSRDNGDWSTNVAMQLAKKAGMAPRDLAAKITAQLDQVAGLSLIHI